VDAPVGRLAEHADRGESLFMVGASQADFLRVRPLLDAMGTTVYHCGDVGTGGRTKLVNNFVAVTLTQVNAEALALSQRLGLDLTRTLAVEWAPDRIRVNAIAPGPIPTEGVRKAFTPPSDSGIPDLFAATNSIMEKYARERIPLGRWGSPRDIANMVAYLASPAGDWITGSIFVVDGGEWLAKH
jgi:hypothetical protein